MNGSLVNARVGTALHPQSAAMAGGMTYRPVPSLAVASATPAEDAAGAPPTPAASFCPCDNKRGLPCGSDPLAATGMCLEHSKKAAKVVAGLLGAAA